MIENAASNVSAHSPDLPDRVATVATREETGRNMYESIRMHVEGLLEDGIQVPANESFAEYVVVGE